LERIEFSRNPEDRITEFRKIYYRAIDFTNWVVVKLMNDNGYFVPIEDLQAKVRLEYYRAPLFQVNPLLVERQNAVEKEINTISARITTINAVASIMERPEFNHAIDNQHEISKLLYEHLPK